VSSLAALRHQIAAVVAPPAAVHDAIATGVPALDAVLPAGGIPCGRLTEIAGRSGSGATTLARLLVASAIGDKRWVAYIDTARTLAPADWAPLAASGRLWIVRPPAGDRGAWCADLLLRSNAFGLVVLDDTTPIPRSVAVRLTRLAQEGNAAFVVVHHHDGGHHLVGSALRLQMQRTPPGAPRPAPPSSWRRIGTRLARAARGQGDPAGTPPPDPSSHRTSRTYTCTVSKGGKGGPQAVEVHCAIDVARRLRADPPIPDRRGVATRNRLGQRAAPDVPGARRATPAPDGVGGTALPRKRRCAEPDTSRDEFLLVRRETGDGRRERRPATLIGPQRPSPDRKTRPA
jgi:hypothetical protein